MCMFAAEARVYGTEIFATQHKGRQVLVYQAKVESPTSNAMILPVPVASPGAAIELLDLGAYPAFIGRALIAYYPHFLAGLGDRGMGIPMIFAEGPFEASIVPTIADFAQLHGRLQLSEPLLALLRARYSDYSFIVLQFGPGRQKLLPCGFSFQSRFPEHLFFPTLHVLDGQSAPEAAEFNHAFSAQGAQLDRRAAPIAPYRPEAPESLSRYDFHLPWPSFFKPHAPFDTAERKGRFRNEDILAALMP